MLAQDKLAAFAAYLDGPFLMLLCGNGDLRSDPAPLFVLGKSPHNPRRLLGMMAGVLWEDDAKRTKLT